MARKPRLPAKSSSKPPYTDGDGNHVRNEILLGLPREERAMLLPKLELVRLKTQHLLHDPGDTLKSVPDVCGVFKWNSLFVSDQWCTALQLSLHSVTSIAIFWNHLAL